MKTFSITCCFIFCIFTSSCAPTEQTPIKSDIPSQKIVKVQLCNDHMIEAVGTGHVVGPCIFLSELQTWECPVVDFQYMGQTVIRDHIRDLLGEDQP